MYKSYSMELAGRTLTVDVNRVAKQANGAALMHYGDTTVLSTATASEKPREGIDFFPLSVEYEEKMYAVGKIPGGFNKREGKASENAILTSRVIDRPMRPLFPKDYRNDVTLNNLVLSVDPDCAPELTAMLGSAIAVSISDIPFDGPTATTQVGLIDGEFVFNPNAEQRKVSDLTLTVASTREKVIMIEAGAKEIPEAKMIEAIFAAHEVNQKIIAFIDTIVAECGKAKHEYEHVDTPEDMYQDMVNFVTPEAMEEAVVGKGEMNDTCTGVHIVNEMDVPVLAMGLHDVVISASPEGILVSDKEQSSYIKPFVDKFQQQIMFAEKSWGSFKVIDVETESMTIKVTLNAGHSMNYHSHKNRDEVWVVISGNGKTIVDGFEQVVKAGDVITMSAGCRHTVMAETELKLIEVQLGTDINVHDKQKFALEY